jgi:glycosyltransferase involved in cell wall biosynthesis
MASSSAERGARPRILMASLHDWDGPLTLGSHHLARGLVAAGWEVAYVSNGVSPAHVLRDPVEFRRRVAKHSRSGHDALDGRLWAYTPFALLTPHNRALLRSGLVHHNWQRTTVPNLVAAVRSHGFLDVDLLYIDSPLQAFWLDKVSFRVSVARVVDRSSGFHGVAGKLLELERHLIRSVDLVAYTAKALERDILAMGARRALHLPNGVDFEHFAGGSAVRPDDLREIPSPIAVYVGDMAKWFDFATVGQVAERLPDVSFVFIGPDRLAREMLPARRNVHILGPRPFAELPAYLHNSDVGLIPFDVQRFPDAVNAVHPLKLYEYFACGLPVVATRWDELERLSSPALLCRGVDQFVAGIGAAIDDPGLVDERIAFARTADWSNRVRSLLEATSVTGAAGVAV